MYCQWRIERGRGINPPPENLTSLDLLPLFYFFFCYEILNDMFSEILNE